MNMYYFDGQCAVELYDQVEVKIDGATHEGVITRLHPRSEQVTVRYQDEIDTTRSGAPRTKSARVPLSRIELIARDG